MSPCDELPPNLTEQTSRSNLGMSGHEGIETEAGWLAGDLNSTSWLEDASADEESEGSSILAASSVQGNLAERCWLSDEPEDIDKSLEQAVAVSPTRPCLVEIPRRSTSLPRKDSMEVSQNSGTSGQVTPQRSLRRVKCYTTLTPPKTPTYARALDYDDDKTPTQQSLQAKDQHMLSRIQKTASIISQITADNIGHPLLTLDQEQGDILSHLQFSIAQFPSTMLQIDSPVILALRKPPIPSYPHPHPHDKRRSVRFNMPDPSTHRSSIYTAVPSPPHSRPNSASNDPSRLAPLRIIFPETSNFLRETLYAHFIALNYLENLFTPLLPAFDIPQHTPPKAMAMLGIIPATNCVDDDKVNSEEIRDVKVGLRLCIGRLMEAICGRGRGVGDELLMVSVGQVVKLIETGRYKEDLP
ncbi:MAG: hypothetical protein M1827_007312 [Pycnora praestabilis]|nr:MAG: hypothetical protein M1827_007312 [Pycnora praestabilis]